MKPAKIRDMTDEELVKKESELDEQLLKLQFQLATKQTENPMMIRAVRKDIARIKTIRAERRREAS